MIGTMDLIGRSLSYCCAANISDWSLSGLAILKLKKKRRDLRKTCRYEGAQLPEAAQEIQSVKGSSHSGSMLQFTLQP